MCILLNIQRCSIGNQKPYTRGCISYTGWHRRSTVLASRTASLQASAEASLRKYGLYLLQAALPSGAQKAPPWSPFLVLYELLDEYALHLIQVLLQTLLLPWQSACWKAQLPHDFQ